MRLGPERRVRKRPEFQAIQKSGRRVSTKHFVLIVALAERPTSAPRLGITASRKVGNSVRRSRLKRLVRAAFQDLPDLLPEGHDLVVICKQDDPGLKKEHVLSEWQAVRSRLRKVVSDLQRSSVGS